MLKKFLPQNFNDLLALFFITLAIMLWIIQGLSLVSLREDVNGALVVLVTLIVQFYFRTRPPTDTNGGTK